MKFLTLNIAGMEESLRGMRYPLKSLDKSTPAADIALAGKLIKAGREHRKFLRMIFVWVEIAAPRYWWIEFDTYKIGVSCNSESTMHTIMRDGVSIDDFDIQNDIERNVINQTVYAINALVELYKEEKEPDKRLEYLRSVKAILPESFIQRRIVCLNYETLRTMYHQRKDHRLKDWRLDFCQWCETLPDSWMITGD